MYVRYDGPTQTILGWLNNDPDQFYWAQKMVKEWREEPDSDPETILSDLASYVAETLAEATPHSSAGKTRASLSDADLACVDWQAVLDRLTEE